MRGKQNIYCDIFINDCLDFEKLQELQANWICKNLIVIHYLFGFEYMKTAGKQTFNHIDLQ